MIYNELESKLPPLKTNLKTSKNRKNKVVKSIDGQISIESSKGKLK
jgi:hypothetical protein